MDALYRIRLEWSKRDNWYTAEIAANQLNKMRPDETSKVWTAEELLAIHYPMPKQSVIITHDPDHGALGGESLRGRFQDMTAAAARNRKLPRRMPRG